MIQNHKNGFSGLVWYNAKKYQERYKSWFRGAQAPVLVEQNQLPPFQLIKEKTGNVIDVFKLIYVNDGTEYDILSDLSTFCGLSVNEDDDNYDVVLYPSINKIPNSGAFLPVGEYYCEMTIGPDSWTSEIFSMCDDVSQFLKIEYCHSEDLEFFNGAGRIIYGGGYKGYYYLDAVLAKPEYRFEKDLVNRQGRPFPRSIISSKVYAFTFAAMESTIDSFRLIPPHDRITISFNGQTWTADDMDINVNWDTVGDVAIVDVTFSVDTVVFISGRSGTTTCDPTEGSCLAGITSVTMPAVAMIVQGSAEYLGGYYVSEETGLNVPLEVEDKIIIRDPDNPVYVLYSWDGATYVLEGTSAGESVYTYNEQKYWFDYGGSVGLKTTEITSVDYESGIVQGYGISNSVIEVWLKDVDGNEWIAGIGTQTIVESPGISFTPNTTAISIQLRSRNSNCGIFDISDWFDLEGIGYWIIEDTFEVQ